MSQALGHPFLSRVSTRGRGRQHALELAIRPCAERLESRLLLADHPLLVVPGFGGTMPADDTDLTEWLTTRGIAPQKLQVDPLANVYDDLIATLEAVGYIKEQTLFVANWDWRVPVAPQDGTANGILENVTTTAITDATYETGLDYLGYWLKKAADTWTEDHPGQTLEAVDLITHSTGGLVARSYIQSAAYGVGLPIVHDLVLAGVPNQGAGDIWTVLHDDFNSSIATRGAGLIVHSAWDLAEQGAPILNPDGTEMAFTDHESFIASYIGAATDLLPVFPFLDSDLDGTYEILSGQYQNNLLLDLNAAGPAAFTDPVTGLVSVVHGTGEDTIIGVEKHTGPTLTLLPTVQHFDELLGHYPATGEVWYSEVEDEFGDGTVTSASALWQLTPISGEVTLKPQTVGHRGLVSDLNAQTAILDAIGVIAYEGKIVADPNGGDSGLMQLASKVFNEAALFESLADGIGNFFDKLQSGFNSVFGRLPLVGDSFIDQAGTFFSDFGGSLAGLVEMGPAGMVSAVQHGIFDVLTSVLHDINGDGRVNSDDVAIGLVDGALQFQVELGGNIAGTSADIGFDVGLDALGLELAVEGGVDLSVDWSLSLGFGITTDVSSFYIVCDNAHEASLTAKVSLTDGTMLRGKLGFLQLTASDFADADDDRPGTDDLNGHTGIYGSIGIDLREPGYYNSPLWPDTSPGRLTLAEMNAMPAEGGPGIQRMVVGTVDAGADINLHLVTGFGNGASFPSILADLDIDWDFLQADTSGAAATFGGMPEIAFNNVGLDLGSFISDFVSPILEKVQIATKPMQPVIDILTMDIPVISDLDGPVSLLDLAELLAEATGGKFNPKFIAAVETVFDLIEALNGLDTSGNIIIPFGSFPLTGGDVREMSDLSAAQTPEKDDIDPAAGLSGGTKTFIQKLKGAEGLRFPILSSPMSIFSLICGRDVDVFRYEMPELELRFDYEKSFMIFPLLTAKLGGFVSAEVDLDFGFDTTGIRKYMSAPAQDKDLSMIFDGFYIDDHCVKDGTGKVISDGPELTFSAGIEASAALGGVVFEAGVTGGLYANVYFDLNDNPPDDGKIRFKEFELLLDIDPTYLFEVSGNVRVGLSAYIWVGIDLWIKRITFYRKRFNIFSATLVDFNYDPLPDVPPEWATRAGPYLILNMGGNLIPGAKKAESYAVSRALIDKNNDGTKEEYYIVTAYGVSQEYPAAGITRITADGGDGDDRITIGKDITADVVINGGTGNDTIRVLGTGRVTVNGGDGDDELYVTNAAAASVDGGNGNDTIQADTALPASLFGGAGNDLLMGGSGDDLLDGGDGDDELRGGAGGDRLVGGVGNDILDGGEGDDDLAGGVGDDEYLWNAGAGADLLREDELAPVGSGDQLTVGGGKNASGADIGDNIRLSRYSSDGGITWKVLVVTGLPGDQMIVDNVERLAIAPGGGADTVTFTSLSGTDPTDVGVDLGRGDEGSLDRVVFEGSDQDDEVSLKADMLDAGSELDRTVTIEYIQGGQAINIGVRGSKAGEDRMELRGMGGNDALSVLPGANGVRVMDLADVSIDSGPGSDLITSVYGNVIVVGGPAGDAGVDTLVVLDDPQATGRPDVRLEDDRIEIVRAGTAAQLMQYSSVEAFELDMSTSLPGTDLRVQDTIAGPVAIRGAVGNHVTIETVRMPMTVDLTGANNTIMLGAGSLQAINANMMISGAGHRLVINDSADPADHLGTAAIRLDLGTLSGSPLPAGSAVTYANLASMELRLGTGDNEVDVPVLAIPVTVVGGLGNDTVTARLIDASPLGSLAATTSVDTVWLTDARTGMPLAWTQDSGGVRTGTALVLPMPGAALTHVVLGAGDDRVTVSHVSSDIHFYTGAGADSVRVAPVGIAGSVSFSGDAAGTGQDTLTIDNAGQAAAVAGRFGSGTITGFGMTGWIGYDGIEAMVFQGTSIRGDVLTCAPSMGDAASLALADRAGPGLEQTGVILDGSAGAPRVDFFNFEEVGFDLPDSTDALSLDYTFASVYVWIDGNGGDDTITARTMGDLALVEGGGGYDIVRLDMASDFPLRRFDRLTLEPGLELLSIDCSANPNPAAWISSAGAIFTSGDDLPIIGNAGVVETRILAGTSGADSLRIEELTDRPVDAAVDLTAGRVELVAGSEVLQPGDFISGGYTASRGTLDGVSDVAVVGGFLYATCAGDDTVAVFKKLAGEELELVQVIPNGCAGPAPRIVASSDGRSIYTTASTNNAIHAFSRDAITGRLSLIQVVVHNQAVVMPGVGNGSFETGDFTGWSTMEARPSSALCRAPTRRRARSRPS